MCVGTFWRDWGREKIERRSVRWWGRKDASVCEGKLQAELKSSV